jgi:hypothetical protein
MDTTDIQISKRHTELTYGELRGLFVALTNRGITVYADSMTYTIRVRNDSLVDVANLLSINNLLK